MARSRPKKAELPDAVGAFHVNSHVRIYFTLDGEDRVIEGDIEWVDHAIMDERYISEVSLMKVWEDDGSIAT